MYEVKKVEKLLSMVDNSVKCIYPLAPVIEKGSVRRAWPIPPLFYISQIEGKEIRNWRAYIQATHKNEGGYFRGRVVYRERGKIGDNKLEIELRMGSTLSREVILSYGMEPIKTEVVVDSIMLNQLLNELGS